MFLQSQQWQQFQEAYGRQCFRIDGILVIKFPLKFRLSWLYCPMCKLQTISYQLLVDLAKKENAIFVKIEPIREIGGIGEIRDIKQEKSTNLQPRQSLQLDLSRTEDELLAQMKPKTRYNIRLAEKHGVKILQDLENSIDIFWKLGNETTTRDKFSMHTRTYYEQMGKILRDNITCYAAEFGGKYLASILVLHDKEEKIAYYLHGVSSNQSREVMATYLLQWQAIKDAKSAGMKWYDFWGVKIKSEARSTKLETNSNDQNPENSKHVSDFGFRISDFPFEIDHNHKWAGITRFKLGFAANGKLIEYPQAVDLIIKPILYKIYKIVKHLSFRT
ncbi:MAG: femAB family protein [Candidatus Berkelbacteria bacterium Licking1014_85]|uniref:FemAB family protein n=1 Tax=Candidatus Berkelbacteria bacterium Licking1014_85 TaxID=2017148 RepID=A0A554LKD4_9BACT|nr:MAG: femAB family protein [Candidatus Berkelbacteria bacterium Licking1014_85]